MNVVYLSPCQAVAVARAGHDPPVLERPGVLMAATNPSPSAGKGDPATKQWSEKWQPEKLLRRFTAQAMGKGQTR